MQKELAKLQTSLGYHIMNYALFPLFSFIDKCFTGINLQLALYVKLITLSNNFSNQCKPFFLHHNCAMQVLLWMEWKNSYSPLKCKENFNDKEIVKSNFNLLFDCKTFVIIEKGCIFVLMIIQWNWKQAADFLVISIIWNSSWQET